MKAGFLSKAGNIPKICWDGYVAFVDRLDQKPIVGAAKNAEAEE